MHVRTMARPPHAPRLPRRDAVNKQTGKQLSDLDICAQVGSQPGRQPAKAQHKLSCPDQPLCCCISF